MKGALAFVCCLGLLSSLRAQELTEEEILSKYTEEELIKRNAARRAVAEKVKTSTLANLRQWQSLVGMTWRRDTAGNFEFMASEDPQTRWASLFRRGIADGFEEAGRLGKAALLLHRGDVLSLADGSAHLHRLGVGVTTPDLVAFVRSAIPPDSRDLALLDRMVAIDALTRQSTPEAKAARDALAADQSLDQRLSDRLAGAPLLRAALDPAKLALPTRFDVAFVINNDASFDATALMRLGRHISMTSSAQVIHRLKFPDERNAAELQACVEILAELPFELVRQFGHTRLDQTCVAVRFVPKTVVEESFDGMEPSRYESHWCASGVGRFEPSAIVANASAMKVEATTAEVVDGTARVALGATTLAVTDTLATARTGAFEMSPRPELATKLLRPGAGVRVHVPTGSLWLASLTEAGVTGVESIDVAVKFGETVTFDAVARTKDAATAPAPPGR